MHVLPRCRARATERVENQVARVACHGNDSSEHRNRQLRRESLVLGVRFLSTCPETSKRHLAACRPGLAHFIVVLPLAGTRNPDSIRIKDKPLGVAQVKYSNGGWSRSNLRQQFTPNVSYHLTQFWQSAHERLGQHNQLGGVFIGAISHKLPSYVSKSTGPANPLPAPVAVLIDRQPIGRGPVAVVDGEVVGRVGDNQACGAMGKLPEFLQAIASANFVVQTAGENHGEPPSRRRRHRPAAFRPPGSARNRLQLPPVSQADQGPTPERTGGSEPLRRAMEFGVRSLQVACAARWCRRVTATVLESPSSPSSTSTKASSPQQLSSSFHGTKPGSARRPNSSNCPPVLRPSDSRQYERGNPGVRELA